MPLSCGPPNIGRSKLRRVANVERADSRRRAKLVTAERHQIAAERGHVDRDSADRLRRIDMKQRAGLLQPCASGARS